MTVTSAGQIKVKDIGIPEGRVLRAELCLPDLQERCEGSSDKHLFKISKILADNEHNEESMEDSSHLERNMSRGRFVNPWDRAAQVPRIETVSVKPIKISSDMSSIIQRKAERCRKLLNSEESSDGEVLENLRRLRRNRVKVSTGTVKFTVC